MTEPPSMTSSLLPHSKTPSDRVPSKGSLLWSHASQHIPLCLRRQKEAHYYSRPEIRKRWEKTKRWEEVREGSTSHGWLADPRHDGHYIFACCSVIKWMKKIKPTPLVLPAPFYTGRGQFKSQDRGGWVRTDSTDSELTTWDWVVNRSMISRCNMCDIHMFT